MDSKLLGVADAASGGSGDLGKPFFLLFAEFSHSLSQVVESLPESCRSLDVL